jgi:hypothetical protein
LKLEKHLLEMEKEWSETSSMKRRVRKYQRKHNEGGTSFQFLVESYPPLEIANKTSGENPPNEVEHSNASYNMLLPKLLKTPWCPKNKKQRNKRRLAHPKREPEDLFKFVIPSDDDDESVSFGSAIA